MPFACSLKIIASEDVFSFSYATLNVVVVLLLACYCWKLDGGPFSSYVVNLGLWHSMTTWRPWSTFRAACLLVALFCFKPSSSCNVLLSGPSSLLVQVVIYFKVSRKRFFKVFFLKHDVDVLAWSMSALVSTPRSGPICSPLYFYPYHTL